jgi:hypothetical protein
MTRKHDNQCTPFTENLVELGKAIVAWVKSVPDIRFRKSIRFLVFPDNGSGTRIGHELKNTFWAEPLRKIKGECPQKDEHGSSAD